MMAAALAQARSCGFTAYYWAHDVHLWDGTIPFTDLRHRHQRLTPRPGTRGRPAPRLSRPPRTRPTVRPRCPRAGGGPIPERPRDSSGSQAQAGRRAEKQRGPTPTVPRSGWHIGYQRRDHTNYANAQPARRLTIKAVVSL